MGMKTGAGRGEKKGSRYVEKEDHQLCDSKKRWMPAVQWQHEVAITWTTIEAKSPQTPQNMRGVCGRFLCPSLSLAHSWPASSFPHVSDSILVPIAAEEEWMAERERERASERERSERERPD